VYPPTPRVIDLATYPRADILKAFADRALPQLSVPFDVDVTHIRQVCQAQARSFFLGMSYAVSCAVQSVAAFRQRVIDGCRVPYRLDGKDAWIQFSDGNYERVPQTGHSAQQALMALHGSVI